MTGIIDYNAGNIKSVARALDALKVEYCISKSPNDLYQSERLIFPGVGDAQYAMGELRKSGFDVFLKEKAKDGIPILGICLGSQIIFDYSEEGNTNCSTFQPFNSSTKNRQASHPDQPALYISPSGLPRRYAPRNDVALFAFTL